MNGEIVWERDCALFFANPELRAAEYRVSLTETSKVRKKSYEPQEMIFFLIPVMKSYFLGPDTALH